MSVAQRLAEIKTEVGLACGRVNRRAEEIRIIAVTKTANEAQIREAAATGLLDFGENRLQVLQEHAKSVADLPEIQWHMIGHLQRNKVRDVLPLVSMIQSVDSLRLAQEIQKVVSVMDRRVPVLLEVNAGDEPQKYGATVGEAVGLAREIAGYPNLQLEGLMTMAPLTEDQRLIRAAFGRARALFEQIRQADFAGEGFRELSMGMSHDFAIAVECGSTMLRIGSRLFGEQ